MDSDAFARILSGAIDHRGLTLSRICARLEAAGVPISVATLSYWRSGRSIPEREVSMKALPVLEAVLGLNPGTLTASLPASKPRGRTATRQARYVEQYDEMFTMDSLHRQLMDELDINIAGRLTRLNAIDRIIITSKRAPRTWDYVTTWRAERSGVQSFPLVYSQGPDGLVDSFIEPLSMCSVGRVLIVKELSIVMAEMLFPEPLKKGDIVMSHCRFRDYPEEAELNEVQVSTAHTIHETALEVRFIGVEPPTHIQRFVRPDWEGAAVEREDVRLYDGVCQVARVGGAAPLVMGYEWSWDGRKSVSHC